ITGTWTFNSSTIAFQQEDRMQVVTRTDAVPAGPPYGEVQSGIAFAATMGGDSYPSKMWISDYGVTNGDLVEAPMNLRNGDTFQFTVRDDGYHVSFTIQPVGGAATTITATTTTHYGVNYIDFYNGQRGANPDPHVSYLDDVLVTGNQPDL